MKDRLKQFVDYLGITINQFEQNINVGQSSINRAILGKSCLQVNTILKIFAVYPTLNLDWLLTGRGEMLVDFSKLEDKKGKNAAQQNSSCEKKSQEDPLVQFLKTMLDAKDARIETLVKDNALLSQEISRLLVKETSAAPTSQPMEVSTI